MAESHGELLLSVFGGIEGDYRRLQFPGGHLMICTGNVCLQEIQRSPTAAKELLLFISKLPYTKKFFLAGAKDYWLQQPGVISLAQARYGVHVLLGDEGAFTLQVPGALTIFGSPVAPRSPSGEMGAFRVTQTEYQEIVAAFPKAPDLLITPEPPQPQDPLDIYLKTARPLLHICSGPQAKHGFLEKGIWATHRLLASGAPLHLLWNPTTNVARQFRSLDDIIL